jgi:hypothetical protein
LAERGQPFGSDLAQSTPEAFEFVNLAEQAGQLGDFSRGDGCLERGLVQHTAIMSPILVNKSMQNIIE